MLKLKNTLGAVGSSQAALARYLGVSQATVTLICKHDQWPKAFGGAAALRGRIGEYLTDKGAPPEMVAAAFDDEAPADPRGNAGLREMAQATTSGPQPGPDQEEDLTMLLRHHTLSQAARQHFRVPRDPFVDEMSDEADVFSTDDIRYVRAAMRQTAKHGGMLAVVAQSGGGKSILRKDLGQWVADSGEPIKLIEPFVLGLAGKESEGTPMTAADIVAAVIRALAPGESLPQRLQDRSAKMKRLLDGSAQVGCKHVLIIEEAHALGKPAIKQLKRFYELESGFRKLLAIILVGQQELEDNLNENDPSVREVVQRCELVRLPPLDNHVGGYLAHKFKRVEMDAAAVLEAGAVEAIRAVLRTTETKTHRGQRQVQEVSLCHPLAVNNLVTLAMNEAVKIGAPKVTAALIHAAVRGV